MIELLDANGNLVATTTTDANGEYRFDGLQRGRIPGARAFSRPATTTAASASASAGGAAATASTRFTASTSSRACDAMQYDFCEKVGVMLSGNVYHDRDNDGIFDRGTRRRHRRRGAEAARRATATTRACGRRPTRTGFYKFNNLRGRQVRGRWKFIRPAGSTASTRRATWAAWPTFRRRAT